MSLWPILRPPYNLWALYPGGDLRSTSAILLFVLTYFSTHVQELDGNSRPPTNSKVARLSDNMVIYAVDSAGFALTIYH